MKGVHQYQYAKTGSLAFLSDCHSSKKSHAYMPVLARLLRNFFGELVEFELSAR